jgi:hypothetical protein
MRLTGCRRGHPWPGVSSGSAQLMATHMGRTGRLRGQPWPGVSPGSGATDGDSHGSYGLPAGTTLAPEVSPGRVQLVTMRVRLTRTGHTGRQ